MSDPDTIMSDSAPTDSSNPSTTSQIGLAVSLPSASSPAPGSPSDPVTPELRPTNKKRRVSNTTANEDQKKTQKLQDQLTEATIRHEATSKLNIDISELNDPPVYESLDLLAYYLDMTKEDCREWLDSPRVMKFYKELYETLIKLQKENDDNFRGPSLNTVLSVIKDDDSTGEHKFWRVEDKSDWNVAEHYAYCFIGIKQDNIKSKNGAFFGKAMQDHDINHRVWQTILRLNHTRSKSRKGKEVIGGSEPGISSVNTSKKTLEQLSKSDRSLAVSRSNGSSAAKNTTKGISLNDNISRDMTIKEKFVHNPKRSRHGNTVGGSLTTASSEGSFTTGAEKDTLSPLVRTHKRQKTVTELVIPGDKSTGFAREFNKPISGAFKSGALMPEEGINSNSASEAADQVEDMVMDVDDEVESSDEVWFMEEGESNDEDETDDNEDETDDDDIDIIKVDTPDVTEPRTVLDDIFRTRNEQNLLDLGTRYGQYSVIHSVVRLDTEPFNLIRRTYARFKATHLQNQDGGGDIDDQQSGSISASERERNNEQRSTLDRMVESENRIWHRELKARQKGQRVLRIEGDNVAGQNRHDDAADFLTNSELQPQKFKECCLRYNLDDTRPRLPGMPVTLALQPWQVTGIARCHATYRANDTKGIILADATGLGKTWEILAFWLILQNERADLVANPRPVDDDVAESCAFLEGIWMQQKKDGLHNEEISPYRAYYAGRPSKAMPKLLLVPIHLIYQWYHEISRFSDRFKPIVYYGDSRSNKSGPARGHRETPMQKVDGNLTRDHALFNGDEANSNVIIVSAITTMVVRHGAKAQKDHPDPEGGTSPRDLRDLFELVAVDEAHCLKNLGTKSYRLITGLNCRFLLLSTASVIPDCIDDLAGYIPFVGYEDSLWATTNLTKWNVTPDVNPFELPDNHPAVKLRLTSKAVDKFITPREVEAVVAGKYTRSILRNVLIRRTYASPDPGNPSMQIGDAIARISSRRIECAFDPSERGQYLSMSKTHYLKLVHRIADGTVVWNRTHSRKLILLSTWLGYYYIDRDIGKKSIEAWMASDNLLFDWVSILHKRLSTVENLPEMWKFDMPKKNDALELLRIVCIGSPKLRKFLHFVEELVVLRERKLIVWSALPVNQLLIHACLQQLRIQDACFTSVLSSSKRAELVVDFTTSQKRKVFNGSWFVGSCGLNLQSMCHHMCFFDTAGNIDQKNQGIGRIRRLGQMKICEIFDVAVTDTFQTFLMARAMEKAIPGAIADLTWNLDRLEEAPNPLKEANKEDNIKIDLGWFLLDDDLVHESDARFRGPSPEQLPPARLSVWGLVKSLLTHKDGTTVLASENELHASKAFGQYEDVDWQREDLGNRVLTPPNNTTA